MWYKSKFILAIEINSGMLLEVINRGGSYDGSKKISLLSVFSGSLLKKDRVTLRIGIITSDQNFWLLVFRWLDQLS